jgi:hypothetical protein
METYPIRMKRVGFDQRAWLRTTKHENEIYLTITMVQGYVVVLLIALRGEKEMANEF